MAFLRPTGQEQNNLLSGAGGMAGQGAPVGSRQETTAGQPGSWYNIQDFLRANPQTPAARSRIEQKGAEQLSGAVGQYQGQVSGLPQMPTPTAYSQDQLSSLRQGGITGSEAQNIKGFLGQSFAGAEPGTQAYERAPQEQLPGVASPYENIKPGDFGSLMNWYGELEKPSAAYTPGMQKMDELLLRGQKGFAEQFPQQMESQFQQQVTQPMEQKRAEIGEAQTASKQQFSDEGKKWFEGISGFLGGEKEKVGQRMKEQEATLAANRAKSVFDVIGPKYTEIAQQYPTYDMFGGTNPYIGQPEYQRYNIAGIDPSQYVTQGNIYDPNMQTAATSYFTPEQMQTYNTLAGLVPDAGYNYYTGAETFAPGTWSFNEPGFEADYNRIISELGSAKQAEQNKELQRQRDEAARLQAEREAEIRRQENQRREQELQENRR